MGARWLLGGAWRLLKVTSSVVIFFDKKLALGCHLKVKGKSLLIYSILLVCIFLIIVDGSGSYTVRI